ncbi:MAG: FAD binding domain-containing protein [Firmicutes bacterium]|nr:FAD binding domain-containing protein [Bacillota bacterium]
MEIKHFHRATSLEDAHKTLLQDPSNIVLGGGLWVKKTTTNANTLIDLSGLKLDQIKDTHDVLEIGAMVSLRDFETHPAVKSLNGGFLSSATSQIMGVAFRRLATVGGTVAGRFAFSDLLTSLLTLPVTLVFFPKKEMSLEQYLSAKGKTTDILTSIIIKKEPGIGYFKKVSNTVLDFAILNVAVTHFKEKYVIAVGARPAGAVLALKAMEYLNGQKNPTLAEFEKAAELASEAIGFLTTSTASESYRKTLARTYVRRGLEEVAHHEG